MVFAEELGRWWKIIRNIALFVGALLSVVILVDLVEAYATLRGVHPWLGYALVVALAGGALWLATKVLVSLLRTPSVLRAPAIADPDQLTEREREAYAKYLVRYAERLVSNGAVPEELRNEKRTLLATLMEKEGPPAAAIETDVIAPLLATLDEKAQRIVRDVTRNVMLGVAFLPWRSADLILVVQQNTKLVLQLTALYESRPLVREQMNILRDTLRVVAAINFLNLGRGFIESLGKAVPVVGRYIDNIAEGFGAGFLTFVTGQAAIDRCRAYRGWSYEQGVEGMKSHLKGFFVEVGKMVTADLMPHIYALASEQVKRLWDNVRSAVASTFEKTADGIGRFVRKGKAGAEPA